MKQSVCKYMTNVTYWPGPGSRTIFHGACESSDVDSIESPPAVLTASFFVRCMIVATTGVGQPLSLFRNPECNVETSTCRGAVCDPLAMPNHSLLGKNTLAPLVNSFGLVYKKQGFIIHVQPSINELIHKIMSHMMVLCI